MASLSKSRKPTQNLYISPSSLPLENFPAQNPLPVEHLASSRVSRNSRIDPTIANIFGRRTSVRRRPSSRLNDTHSPRGSPLPIPLSQVSQSTGNAGKINDLHNRGVAASKGVRPLTSPLPKQPSPRGTVRTSLMKRLTRRLQPPHSLEEADPASLPIQRVSSTRRRSIRVSSTHRASCRVSSRNSGLRSPSARFSRTPSGIGIPGSANSSRSPSVLLGSIGAAALDDHSSYSTDSELEEQPITMRPHRLERERAVAMAPTLAKSGGIPVAARPLSHDSVADLIEQIAGRIEGRISRDTMSSIYDFSVNDYCNAFPAPPTPGTAPNPLWATSNINYTEQICTDFSPLAEPPFTSLTDRAPTLRTPISHPSLGASNAELKLELTLRTSASWDDWSTWPSPAPAGKKTGAPLVVARLSTAETPVVVTSAEKHQSVSTQVSITSSGLSSPSFPLTPPIARPRSLDPLSQARRKTRIICGQFVENDDEFCGETTKGHDPDSFSAGASIQDGAHASTSRRGSDRSSLISSLVHPPTGAYRPNASIISNYNAYSLNSPIDDGGSANVGVALTTEFRELASPSPISFSEQEDARLTLYARRKGRRTEFTALNQPLRVNPPLLSPSSKNPYSVVSPVNTDLPPGGSGTFGGGTVLPGAQNESATGRAVSTQPPKPAKRKSFFRYPFSSKRSTGSLRVAHLPTNVEGAPPPASPRAKDPPMSAAANKLDFSPYEVSVGGRQPSVVPVQPSAHPVRYPTSRFISFSRPSSSRGKVPVEAGLSG